MNTATEEKTPTGQQAAGGKPAAEASVDLRKTERQSGVAQPGGEQTAGEQTAVAEKSTVENRAVENKGDDRRTVPAATGPRTVSIRLSTALTALAIAVLLIATVTLAILYASARGTIADGEAQVADEQRAEQIAADYALGASTIDYRDVAAWFTRLKEGTAAPLAAKFDATGPQLEQILLPLQWTSTATPLSATVVSESGGVFKVNAYLTVDSTSVQNPDGVQTTVTYSLTIDRNSEWQITDVGGLQNAIPAK